MPADPPATPHPGDRRPPSRPTGDGAGDAGPSGARRPPAGRRTVRRSSLATWPLRVPVDIGQGPVVLILHGFAMLPRTYLPTAERLAERARVIIPDLFDLSGTWRYHRVLDALLAALDRLHVERATVVGHSFGGAFELGLAARQPERVTELVFSDTLAMSRRFGLADEALRHPVRLVHLATAPATAAFVTNWVRHPRQLVEAAWYGFVSGRQGAIDRIAASGIPSHVLWASRDSILPRADGEAFARALGASFTVAHRTDGRPVDHDWMFQDPDLFVAHLDRLGLQALNRADEASDTAGRASRAGDGQPTADASVNRWRRPAPRHRAGPPRAPTPGGPTAGPPPRSTGRTTAG